MKDVHYRWRMPLDKSVNKVYIKRMMKGNEEYNELGDLFYRVLNKYTTSEKIPRFFGISQKLHPSEIHMIDAIGRNAGINVTDLARFLGITKGAVPKMVKKLRAKGLVESYGRSENKKEVYLGLTSEGKKAHAGYIKYHSKRNQFLKNYLSKFSKRDIGVFKKTLYELERYADKIIEM